jgi:hypothetical protein
MDTNAHYWACTTTALQIGASPAALAGKADPGVQVLLVVSWPAPAAALLDLRQHSSGSTRRKY